LSKISDPLLDRIDIHIDVAPVEYEALRSTKKEESSEAVLKRVNNARQIQKERYKNFDVFFNGKLSSNSFKEFCKLGQKRMRL
jgi:magnesium chelatase family protein